MAAKRNTPREKRIAQRSSPSPKHHAAPLRAPGRSFAASRKKVRLFVGAALPLFGTGLGAMGLFGWRRKRAAVAA